MDPTPETIIKKLGDTKVHENSGSKELGTICSDWFPSPHIEA